MMLLRRRVLAMLLGAMLLAALLVLSSLSVVRSTPTLQPTVLQNVQIYTPPSPPPTPEPVMRSSKAGATAALQVKIPQPQVQLGKMQLDARYASVSSVQLAAGLSGSNLPGNGAGPGGDGFGSGDLIMQLNELDSTPMVTSAPIFVYPEQLKRKKIHEFVVMYQIFVDENGHTYPVRVVESPDRTLDQQLLDYAAKVVFTPPVRAGKKVKAQYLWPVKFADTDGPNATPNRRGNAGR